ncbi:VWA domain-containing protein [Methylotenera versatilis]|uniref:VWA domain-containing protein n=1 Tax=Methylotenera versatilis TaxID=1055487 RepID=UPI000647687A|nr:VWA domain-containing protein [Methylotenera versatilis]
MINIYNYFRHRRDISLLTLALILLLIALFKPTVPIKRDIYSYLLVADISQSMNVVDESINGKAVTRMQYQQYLMHRIIGEMPCGTQVGIGLFAGVSVAALYTPIEVCENFAAIEDTIDHLDWRTGWSGNSRIRESLATLARLIRSFPETAQVVYFTDGEETPFLHAFNTRDLTDFQGAKDWLFVGIGSEKGTAIPKLDEKNQVIGYWSNESFALQPGVAQISESNIGTRNDSIASGTNDRFLSKLDEKYLLSVTKEINAKYVNGSSVQAVLSAMKKQPPARRDKAQFQLKWVFSGLAGLVFLAAYLPKHPVKESKSLWKSWLARKKRHSPDIAKLS